MNKIKAEVIQIQEVIDVFYEELYTARYRLLLYDIELVLGDFNAILENADIWELETNVAYITKRKYMTRINFIAARNLVPSSNPKIHKHTWILPDEDTNNKIDHALTDQEVIDVRLIRGAKIESGHYL